MNHEEQTHAWMQHPVLVEGRRAIQREIREVRDFPKQGIVFQDLMPVLADAALFRRTIDCLEAMADGWPVDVIVGIEARGFVLGAALAERLGKGFVPVRKPGKLAGRVVQRRYALEYGEDTLEVQADCVPPGTRALVVDDVLATGGTASAAVSLLQEAGMHVQGVLFLLAIEALASMRSMPSHRAADPAQPSGQDAFAVRTLINV